MQPLSLEIYCREVGPDAQVQLAAGMPPGVAARVVESAPDWDALASPLAQSWQLPEREAAFDGCRYVVTVGEVVVGDGPAAERLQRIQQAAVAALEIVHGEAIHWVASQQIVPPGLLIGEVEAWGLLCLEAGAINVRLFGVDGDAQGDGRLVMDTLGLGAFGLPDLQIDYRWLEPAAVAATLFAAARYLFKQGDVIADGHSIEGCLPGSTWTARRERSIAEPYREVIDLDPGAPYSSGGRE